VQAPEPTMTPEPNTNLRKQPNIHNIIYIEKPLSSQVALYFSYTSIENVIPLIPNTSIPPFYTNEFSQKNISFIREKKKQKHWGQRSLEKSKQISSKLGPVLPPESFRKWTMKS
jgi:hypothetical protein